MKKSILCLLSIAALFTASCSKEDSTENIQDNQVAKVYLNIQGETALQTRASGTGHGVQSDDNTVSTLEIFIFKNTGQGADNGQLELYKKYSSSDLAKGLTGLELTASTGSKVIYAICNSHNTNNFSGVNTLTKFKAETALLKNENLKNFTMMGSKEVTLAATNNVSIPVGRMVARIKLTSVKTAFAGTPLEGLTLNSVKAYLINVHASKLLWNGNDPSSSQILNQAKYIANDNTALSMTGMLYESIADSVNETGNSTARWFYAYENAISAENASKSDYFTRLVIEGKLNGVTYYYPINVNRAGFGYNSSNGVNPGIERNKSYELSVVISKAGSLDPNVPIENGTVSVSVNVENWTVLPSVVINF